VQFCCRVITVHKSIRIDIALLNRVLGALGFVCAFLRSLLSRRGSNVMPRTL
jgi:hypothetical protein